MENKEFLEALRHIIKEETRSAVKEEVQPMKDDINGINTRLNNIETDMQNMKSDMQDIKSETQDMKSDMQSMQSDIVEIKNRTVKIEVTLENEIRPNIQLMMEGHKGLVDTIHDIKKDTSRIERIETELFATREITKDNVQSIKDLQSKRKI